MEDIKTVGLGIGWQDQPVGSRFKTVGRTITETDLVNFISTTGMLEGLFTNIHEAEIKGGRLVPAALIYSMCEGLLVQGMLQGVGFAFLHMELDVKGPTFVGDTIHVVSEIIESRPSKGKPGLGMVRARNEVRKHDGTLVMVYTPLRLLKGSDYKPE